MPVGQSEALRVYTILVVRGEISFLVTIENAGRIIKPPVQGGFMKRSSGPRKTANLSESIHQHLTMYALAASAAGVGALGLGQTAQAKIVYTPANVNIAQNGGLVPLDLNHDGIPDFGLRNRWRILGSEIFATLKVVQARSANEIRKGLPCYPGFLCAAALPKGTKVGVKGQFQQDPKSGLFMVQLDHVYDWGPWLNVKQQAYLGFKFVIKGRTHFGWARLKVSVDQVRQTIAATLTGYAYETIPGKAIVTGHTKGPDDRSTEGIADPAGAKPATLGMLALGAPALSIWRREESGGAMQ
jgi:hypothetical protein